MKILNKISEAIYKVAECENRRLEEIANKGIFFMPEIAFAYTCGKEYNGPQKLDSVLR